MIINVFLRNKRTKGHPHTPPKDHKYSRRAWDGLIKSWRLGLHSWDPEEADEEAGSEPESNDPSSLDGSLLLTD